MLSDRRGKGLAAHSLNPSFFLHVNFSLECSGARLSDGGARWGEGSAGRWSDWDSSGRLTPSAEMLRPSIFSC